MHVDAETARGFLWESVRGLHVRNPAQSARTTVTRRQRRGGLAVAGAVTLSVAAFPRPALVLLCALCTVLYVVVVAYRVALFRRSIRAGLTVEVSEAEARAVPESELRRYTVLIPAYREPEVVERLIRDVERIEYPARLLDVKVLLEEDDAETLAALRAAGPPSYVTAVVVPPGGPRTKPKALNYGLNLARGSYVTVYDAEDRPDPLQLRRAAVAFARHPELACFQARLAYYNGGQNVITRWFETEYLTWFRFFLPGLASRNVPLPLGGTSNHIRRNALLEVHGWDPYNVTEDADLGIRLHRAGLRCGVLGSTTYEEANSDFVNWAKQRSRWQKGYLQTWLVHLRHPRALWRELGPRGFVNVNLFVGGTPLLALLNPVFWALTLLYFVTGSQFVERLFPAPVYYPALGCWVLGNLVVVYLNVVAVRLDDQPGLVPAALLTPVYWVMMSIAAYKALWQLARSPSLWEKTTHGLDAAR